MDIVAYAHNVGDYIMILEPSPSVIEAISTIFNMHSGFSLHFTLLKDFVKQILDASKPHN